MTCIDLWPLGSHRGPIGRWAMPWFSGVVGKLIPWFTMFKFREIVKWYKPWYVHYNIEIQDHWLSLIDHDDGTHYVDKSFWIPRSWIIMVPNIYIYIYVAHNTYENTIFRGMNIHLPAILMWTTGVQGFDPLPYIYILLKMINIDQRSINREVPFMRAQADAARPGRPGAPGGLGNTSCLLWGRKMGCRSTNSP